MKAASCTLSAAPHDASRVEGDSRLPASLDAAVVRLRDPGHVRDVPLAQSLRDARLPQRRPNPAREVVGPCAAAALSLARPTLAPRIKLSSAFLHTYYV
jgi:hypothetical protein